jgi:putative tryptophan/tyrosine transport system substrate-binding protein
MRFARRQFVRQLVFSAGALLASRFVHAQRADKKWRVGFLSLDTSTSEAGTQARDLLPAALHKLGYRQGRNLEIEWRWANGKTAELPRLAAELVAARADVIVARTNDPIFAAREATRTIPIVMLNGNYPVEAGLIDSLARPGGNITGLSYVSPAIAEKQMQILKEIAPATRTVAVLVARGAAGNRFFEMLRAPLRSGAEKAGMTVDFHDVERPEDIPGALEKIAASRADALWYSGASILRTRTEEIMAFMRERKLVSIGTIPTFAEAGGLVHYSPVVPDFYERTASYVDRIFKGARPAELPVEQPTKFEFVINLRTARMLGLNIPQSILLRADRLIE